MLLGGGWAEAKCAIQPVKGEGRHQVEGEPRACVVQEDGARRRDQPAFDDDHGAQVDEDVGDEEDVDEEAESKATRGTQWHQREGGA